MNIKIVYNFAITIKESHDLDELCQSINMDNTSVSRVKSSTNKRAKDGGITIALAGISTGFSALAAVAAAIATWGDQKKYSVTLKSNNFDQTVSGLSFKEYEHLIESLRTLEMQGAKEMKFIVYKNSSF